MVHRVDGPIAAYRGQDDGTDRQIFLINQELADATVFQSKYSLEAHRAVGLELKNPIVAAASPMTGSIDNLKRLEDAGIAAVVLPSLFEEQIEHEEMATHNLMLSGTELSPEARGFFPEMQNYNTGPDQYLKLIAEAKRTLAVPVIPSLNGHTPGGWTHIAKQFEQAGVWPFRER